MELIVAMKPFNAFLSGFGATVGQFVLTASLRIQTNPENKSQFKSVSQERYVPDFSSQSVTGARSAKEEWREFGIIANLKRFYAGHSPTSSSAA